MGSRVDISAVLRYVGFRALFIVGSPLLNILGNRDVAYGASRQGRLDGLIDYIVTTCAGPMMR